ncbi:50S ribosomal protein L3 [Gottschalkia acidurici 9a]|uniref:Large ribosomal subunit protein uL3 n=1 Tax=Gottschalkia acidurici (strain ATCC 7906 / DSM 604 / BCRC 14475 / CIP 104303 / KCTC 5404 / NCIMB 10678 / 9a) TaxID=1128398 RepID=K0B3W1_GOTA9|nr:50S ribosomal protein L3 [Gottschalkia acidurici]AFS79266.1 50S ribosomal protein L3 [Gottschalkia acidurici 9a]
MKSILGKKIGMTQIFTEEGNVIPVTVIEAGPVVVTQKKTNDIDGYSAIQVGYGEVKEKKINKPLKGHFDKSNIAYKKVLQEVRVSDTDAYEVGQEIKADVFAAGDKVDIAGISKGKGFQGSIKRHNQSRGPMSHGSKYHRGVGALSAATYPGRVFKGRKLPGHMGNAKVTVQNLEVVRVDADKNYILVKGAVPGPKGGLLTIKQSIKSK